MSLPIDAAFSQVLQLARNLELKRVTPPVSHEGNLVSKVEHHSGQVPDLRMVCLTEGK